MKGQAARIAVSVLVSAVFLFFAARNVEWAEAYKALQGANYLWMVPLMAAVVWTLYIRAQRWRLFLTPIGVPAMRRLVAATNIGFMANMILPLRAGEVIRPLLVSRGEGVPLGGVLATILLERIFDMFTILLLFGVSVLVVPVTDQVKAWGVTLTGVATIVAVVIVILRWQEDFALRVVRRIADLFPARLGEALFGFVAGFVKALEVLSSPGDFARAFLWSLYLWMVIALVNGLGLLAFHLPVGAAVIITAIIAIAVAVPSAPGYIGSFQVGCLLGLAIFNVEKSDAFAFSLVHHLAQFVATIGAGLYSLWTENMSLKEVR